jgi:hypothetical protein
MKLIHHSPRDQRAKNDLAGITRRVIFRPDTNGLNRFTLLELIAQVYSNRSSEPANQLEFPDLARVTSGARRCEVSHHECCGRCHGPLAAATQLWRAM